AASKRIEDITFDTASGQGRYVYTPAADPPASQTTTEFTTSITGDETHDAPYVNAGVRKGDGNYVFTKDTKITTDDSETVIGGPWTPANSPAISNVNAAQPLNIDMNGRKLTIEATGNGTVVGISAVGKGSQVNIKNAGAISITGTNTGSAYAPTLFANGGGSVHIENGGADLESKVLTLRTVGKKEASPAVIKSMNGVDGAESSITIDGLVDILVDGTYPDGKGANEGVSAVASRVDIGGGSIRATGSAWAAIRAYGEFVSENYGTVNFNVTKGADGLANGAGTNRAVIEGDIVTNGGMGTKGRVSVGLSTADSHWLGNYADTSGYGVTPGQLGAVNLFMKNGSYWKGFSNGSMKVEMSGEGTSWTGFNVGNNMQLKLSDGAIWHNAITQEQKDQSNNPAISRVKYFTGSGGFIDMTGTNRFLASSNSLSGAPVQTGSSSIEEKGLGETGDLTIDEFNGSTTMLYRHDALSPTTIYGGKLTIGKAAAGSTVTMRTDSNGLNTASTKAADQNLVSATLNALANKLYYTAYTTGERNLTGKTEIAEGLTTSSASRTEKITFNEATGQGGYTYKPSTDIPDTQVTTVFTQGITGDVDTDAVYATGGVLKNGKYYFSKATSITADTGIAAADGKPVDITGGSGTTLAINAKNYGIDAAANSKVDMTGDRLSITAADGAANRSIRAAAGSSVGIASGFDIKGAVENNGGTVKLDGTGKTSSLVGNITQNDGTFNLRMTGKNSVLKSDIISKGGNLAVTLDGEGTVFTGSIGTAAKSGVSFYRAGTPTGTRELTLGRMAVWNVTGASDLTKLSAQGTIVQQSNQEARIGSYEGTAKVLYRGTATPDGVLTLRNTGRFTVQNIIGTNNSLTLATDAFSGSDAGDEKVAETLAKRFVYSGDIGNIENEGVKGLRLNAAIADGMTTSAKTYRVRLGANGLSQGVTRVALSDIQYGDYETKLMSGVKSAMTASAMAWRAESNDLMKRLGDLRLSPEQIGTWVRFYRGKSSSDKDRADFRMNYSTIQVGHDWKVSPAWRVGLAGSYMKGSSSYASGSGKNKEGNLGIYGTWTGKDGQYLDLIAKVGRLTNEYSVYNDFGHYVKGDYGAWGGSLSAEYGKRIRGKNGGFIEPQAELIYTHLNGANYAGSTDYMVGGVYQKMYVRQGAFNSLIGRLGIGFGRETNRSTWFAKVSLYHAFSGSLHTDYSDGINPWKHTHQDFKDTWVGAQIGGTVKIGEKCSLYGDFEKTFGGDVKTDWRMDAGVRWSF
ncbi:MAG: autotransporter outer membrane beta-barrel domain-containing protein, partial [Selenomonas artemidis]